jgi:DNA-directed RNA polymerase specialized sigma24 family protein
MSKTGNLVIIPSHFDRGRCSTPICIRTVDDEGRRVYSGWIKAVVPVADPLRALAKNVVGDAWKVSELAEHAVHRLSAKHGEKLGDSPSKRIYSIARWRARDIVAGGKRRRIGYEQELTNEALSALPEPTDFAKAYEDREFIRRLRETLETQGLADISAMMDLYLSESEDAAFTETAPCSQERNTLMHRFLYNLRKAVKLLERRDKRQYLHG